MTKQAKLSRWIPDMRVKARMCQVPECGRVVRAPDLTLCALAAAPLKKGALPRTLACPSCVTSGRAIPWKVAL